MGFDVRTIFGRGLPLSQEGFRGEFASFCGDIIRVDSWLKGDCRGDALSQIKGRTVTLCGSPGGVGLLAIIKSNLFAERLHSRVLKVDAPLVCSNAGLLLAFKHPRNWTDTCIFPHVDGVMPDLRNRNHVIVSASHDLACQKHLFRNLHRINCNLVLNLSFFLKLFLRIIPPTYVLRL